MPAVVVSEAGGATNGDFP
ncbi:hypothetical protein TIFTF001_000280, partial [Ficus carica]